jgi:anti-anti-sigma factor
MAFTSTLEMTNAGVAKVSLSGELDAASAPNFKECIEQAAEKKAKRLVLLMDGLEYIASAGLRVLIFAKQKMGAKVDMYVVGAQEQVMSTLKKTGLDHSFIAADKYDSQLDNV